MIKRRFNTQVTKKIMFLFITCVDSNTVRGLVYFEGENNIIIQYSLTITLHNTMHHIKRGRVRFGAADSTLDISAPDISATFFFRFDFL